MVNVVKQNSRLRLILIAAAIFLIMGALSIGGWLNSVTFQKNCEESLAASYQVAALAAKRNIEYAVRYGNPLHNFNGMEQVLEDVFDNAPAVKRVRLVDKSGQVISDIEGIGAKQPAAQGIAEMPDFTAVQADTAVKAIQVGEEYHVFVPVRDKEGNWLATMDIAVPSMVVKQQVKKYSWTVVQSTVVIAIVSLNFMVFVLFAVPIVDTAGQIRRGWLIAIVGIIFALAQISYSIFSINLFEKAYADMAKSNMSLLTKSVKDDVETMLAQGVPYSELVGLEEYLAQIIAGSPEIAGIAINTQEGQTIAQAAAAQPSGSSHFATLRHFAELLPDRNGTAGLIQIWMSMSYMNAKMQEMLRDAVIIAGLFFLLVFAVISYIVRVWQQRPTGNAAWVQTENTKWTAGGRAK